MTDFVYTLIVFWGAVLALFFIGLTVSVFNHWRDRKQTQRQAGSGGQ